MEGKASIQIGHVNNKDKQKVSLTYYLGPFDSVEEAQTAKYSFDTIAEVYGAEIQNEAVILGEEADSKAEKDAEAKTEEAEKNSTKK